MNLFYKLALPEVVQLGNQLRYAEFRTLLYLKAAYPLDPGPIEVDVTAIAAAFNLDTRTVSRALRQLELLGFIGEVIVTNATILSVPWGAAASQMPPIAGSTDPLAGSTDPLAGSVDPLDGSTDPHIGAETRILPFSFPPDQIKEFIDPQDQASEEEEEEKFSYKAIDPKYKEFLRKKAKGLPQPPNNLHGWIVAAAKKGIYLSEFESLQGTKEVPWRADDKNFSSPEEYWRYLHGRGGNG